MGGMMKEVPNFRKPAGFMHLVKGLQQASYDCCVGIKMNVK